MEPETHKRQLRRKRGHGLSEDERPTSSVLRAESSIHLGPWCLVVVSGPSAGRRIDIAREVVVGRGRDCNIKLAGAGLSRQHARFKQELDGGVSVGDLGSHNGTFVNGQAINGCLLDEGDLITLGSDVALRLIRLPTEQSPQPTPEPTLPLTPRELQVVKLAALGRTTAEIGAVLGVSSRTVRTHLQNVYARLGVHRRSELTLWLMRHGVVT